MIQPNQSDAAIAANVNTEAEKVRKAATQPPAPFVDKRPAPMSDGAATKRNAAAKHARRGTGPLTPRGS